MGLHFHVKFGTDATYTDITEYIKYDSVKFDIQLMSKKFKSVQDSVSATTVYNQTINDKFFSASTWMPAYITYDLQEEQMYGFDTDAYGDVENAYGFLSPGRIFTGAVFPVTKDQYNEFPNKGVSFELVDNSHLLDVDCQQFMYGSEYDVFDPADTTYSVVHQLLYAVGFTDTDISADVMIQKSIGFISYEAKDQTIEKILNELLYEYHHVFYFNEDGQFRLYDWGHDTITIAGNITDSSIKDSKGIKRERNIYEFDGYKILFKNLIEKSNALVYREDVDEEGKLLLSAQAFPTDGEINTVKQEFSTEWLSEDAKLLATSNHQLDLTADVGIAVLTEHYENLEAQIVIKNMDAESKRWYQLDVRADAIYTDKSNDITIPTTAQILDDDIQLGHIYDADEATAFANALYSNSLEYGLHIYEFNSEELFNVGTCYLLERYNKNVLITAKKFNYYEHIYEYECISVGAQVAVTPDIIYRNSSTPAADRPSKQLALEVDFNSIDISARGALLVEQITFKARTLNIPVSTLVWSRSDGGELAVVAGNDYLRTLDTSTVDGEWVTVTVDSTYGGSNYTASYTVKKVYQNPVPKNFEGVDVVPEDVDGEPLISGDYFLWAGDDTPADPPIPELTRGEIYEYTGSEWIVSSDGNKVMTLFDSFADLANDVDSTVIGNAVIKKLVAIEAFIETLGVQTINVQEDGSIGTKDFTEDSQGIPTSGFMLDNPLTPTGRRGRVRSHGGIFNDATIYGSIIHDALVTRVSSPTTPVTFSSKTAWNRKSFWNALSISENSAGMIATNLNIADNAYAYIRKITSASYIKTHLTYQSLAFRSGSSPDTTYTMQGDGYVDISGEVGFYFDFDLNYYQSGVQIRKNGVLVYHAIGIEYTNFSTAISVNKGDVLAWRYSRPVSQTPCELGINWRSPQNCLHVSNATTSWDTIENMTSDYLVRGRWYCSTPITFDSNSYIAYAFANSFIGGFSGLPEGVSIQTDSGVSKVTYGSLNNQPITSVIYYGSSVRLYYSGGYVTFQAGVNADGSFTGWYNASASISVLSKEGILTSNIIPKDTTREIGEFDNPFNKMWAKDIDASGNLTVDGDISAGAISAGAISGSSINTGYGANEVYRISKETIDFGDVSSDTTKYISAFSAGEIRFVYITGSIEGSGFEYWAKVYLPSGYSYDVISVRADYGWVEAGLFSGGSQIMYLTNPSAGDDDKDLEAEIIIRRI